MCVSYRTRRLREVQLVVVTLALAALSLSAPANLDARPLNHRPPEVSGAREFLEAEDLIFSERYRDADVEALLDRAEGAFGTGSRGDSALRAYWQARLALLRATWANQRDDARSAQRYAGEGFDAVEVALAGGEFSEGLRVHADLHSQMMFARGLVYMMRNGTAARDAALRALELDRRNAKAMISVAGYYLNAPPFVGGDPEVGQRILEEAAGLAGVPRTDRYVILGYLAAARAAAGDRSGARAAYTEAEAIYGPTAWLAEVAAEAR